MVVAISILTGFVVLLVGGTEPTASSRSLVGLGAWSAYVQAIGAALLVLLAAPAAYVAISDLRTKRRPVLSVARAAFGSDGLSVYLENVGETTWLSVEIRAWVVHVASTLPPPRAWADALEGTAVAIQEGVKPTFIGNFNSLGANRGRWELLRWGPAASTYDPEWVGEHGIVIWDSSVLDLYNRSYAGSGHTDIEPESASS